MWSELLPPVSPTTRWRIIISVCVLGLIVFAAWSMGWLGVPGLAREDYTLKLEARVLGVEEAIKLADLRRERDYLTAWVSELSRDVFALERDIQEMEKRGKAAPSMFIEHLNKMKNDRERAQRRLNKLEEDHPDITTRPRAFTSVRMTAGE